jgi:hypothetical protein
MSFGESRDYIYITSYGEVIVPTAVNSLWRFNTVPPN